jgi:hypothetical protein
MNTPFDLRLLLFTVVAIAMLAPGLPSVARSPYGLQPTELWLAMLYLLGSTVLSLALCSRILQAISSKSPSPHPLLRLGFLVVVPVICMVAVALPFALVMGLSAVAGPQPFLTHWLLMNKYIGHFVIEAVRSRVWVLAPGAVGVWLWFRPSEVGTARAKNAP